MQPPTIPHKIDNYQVDLNVNNCLTCHARDRAAASAGAAGQRHATTWTATATSSRRSRRGATSATQCHVTQIDAKPLVENRFVDIDEILRRPAAATPARPAAK